jgi:hypothetical protein
MIKQETSINIKIDSFSHSKIKIFAAENYIQLRKLFAKILEVASEDRGILEKSLKKIRK